MYNRPINQSSVVLFADPPPLDDLCMISVSVDKILSTVPSTSRFQIQTIKCREIIFTEPDVIASPVFECESIFHIILQQSLYKTGRIQARFQKLGLEISKPDRVSPSQYQSCLRYTLLAKLAPNWNKAGQWLIQGRDFLMQAGYANAVKMDLNVTIREFFFTIDASTVRFPSLKLEDLDIPAPCYNNFLQNPKAIIHQHSIPMVWCQILPSMKKGKIVSISHELSDDGPFKSYKEIKRHWKNHYGYRLPEDEDDMIYYQINFRPLGEKLFTYPELCLRARDIQRVPRVDPKPILIAFLQDLQKKIPKICGFPLKLHSKVRYPSMDLNVVTQVEKTSTHNLTAKLPCKKLVYRNTDEIQRLVSRNTKDVRTNTLIPQQKTASINIGQMNNSVTGGNINNIKIYKDVQENDKIENSTTWKQSKLNDSENKLSGSSQVFYEEEKVDRKVPAFKPKGKVLCQQSQSAKSSETFQKVIPSFKSKTFKTSVMPSSQTQLNHYVPQTTSSLIVTDSSNRSEKDMFRSKSVPIFNTKKMSDVLSKGNMKQNGGTPKSGNLNRKLNMQPSASLNIEQISRKGQIPSSSKGRKVAASPQNMCKTPMTVKSTALGGTVSTNNTPDRIPLSQRNNNLLQNSYERPVGIVPITPNMCKPNLTQYSGTLSGAMKSLCPRTRITPAINGLCPGTPSTAATKNPYPVTTSTPAMKTICPGTPCTPAMKRPYPSSNESTPVMKKSRPKQQVQDLNVEILASHNQLNKVNTVTLVTWLKERGVICKSKDKKGDLVEKALKLLNLIVPEQ